MVIQMVKFKSGLTEDEVIQNAKERKPQFLAISGLIQKYYVKQAEEGHYAGIYIWDSMASIKVFKESELAAGIAKAYGVVGSVEVEIYEGLFPLREL